jgi:hypothetical protein
METRLDWMLELPLRTLNIHVMSCVAVMSINKPSVIGWTLKVESGLCFLWSEDAANFLFRALRLLDKHNNIRCEDAQGEGFANSVSLMSAAFRHIAGA